MCEKFKKIVSILSLIGTIYLFYMLVVSLFKGGDLAYIDILKNAFNFIGYSSIYAYGFVVDHTPKKDMIQDEIVAEIEVGNSSKLEKISSLVDELLEADSTNDELMTSEFETVSENLAEARDLAGDELISVDDESLVSNVDLPFMSGEFSFDKDENIINSILEEICEKVFLDTLDEKLSFDDVSTTSSDDVHCVESKTLSDIDE